MKLTEKPTEEPLQEEYYSEKSWTLPEASEKPEELSEGPEVLAETPGNPRKSLEPPEKPEESSEELGETPEKAPESSEIDSEGTSEGLEGPFWVPEKAEMCKKGFLCHPNHQKDPAAFPKETKKQAKS